MTEATLTIEALNPQTSAFVGERFSVRLRMRCPNSRPPALIRAIESHDPKLIEIDADLFEREIRLLPGEEYLCTVHLVFLRPGRIVSSPILLVTGIDKDSALLPVPMPPINVMPSLKKEVDFQIESICTYDTGRKTDITLRHIGITPFENFCVRVGPADSVHAGVSEQKHPIFEPNTRIQFTTVIDAPEVSLELDAIASGERVGPISVKLPVPPMRDDATAVSFRFLEPKKLTQATVKLHSLDDDRKEIRFAYGSFAVRGGGERYRVSITPSPSHPTSVKLRGVTGIVEVSEMGADPGTWAFQLVVTSNKVLTSTATLHFDVLTPEGLQQGELNLNIRPQNSKLWFVALTAGAAITVKGMTAVVPALLKPGDTIEAIQDIVTGTNTLFDLVQLVSIPVIRIVLGTVDMLYRQFEEG